MPRNSYETDLTAAEWALVEPILLEYHPSAHPNRTHALREIFDAISYRLRTGCQWRNLPHDLPPWSTVHYYYRRWRRNGLWTRLHAVLRERVRVKAQKEPQPSAGSLDSQTVKSSEKGGSPARLTTMGPRASKVANDSF